MLCEKYESSSSDIGDGMLRPSHNHRTQRLPNDDDDDDDAEV